MAFDFMQLTVREVAGFLNVSEKTIYRWLQKSQIPAYRLNDQYRFNRSEILEWATARKMEVSPLIFSEPEDSAAIMPSLAQTLEVGGIHYRVAGRDRNSALRAVVNLLRLPDDMDREFLTGILLARESMASTGLGDGIAIPHVRNPIVLNVPKPAITLCFLETPIEFGALDGQPVFALFMLISQTVRAHLYLLSRIAFALQKTEVKNLITRQAGRDEILEAFRRMEESMAAPIREESRT
jgi:PTS system nitrogen regulatory IIA component